MDLGKVLLEALEEAAKRRGPKLVVGSVDPSYYEKFDDLDEEVERLGKEANARIEMAKETIKLEYMPKVEAVQQKHNALWDEVYKQLDIPVEQQDKMYSISKKGVITTRG